MTHPASEMPDSEVGHAGRIWLLAALGGALVGGLIPLIWDRRFYFHGDTQIGAVGQWFHLGMLLRAGHWPILDPQAWPAGNIISEGQWGLFSPLTMLIALAITGATNLVIFVTVLKLGLILVFGSGTFSLIRSYSVAPHWCALGALAVTLGGVSQYLESPSWVTGQMVIALLPWAWYFIRRATRGASLFPAMLVGYLIVSVGYVYGTMYLAIVLTAVIVERLIDRDLRGAVRTLLIGVSSGLVAIAVYLPGMLSASVTTRGGWELIDNGRLQPDLVGLFSSMLPTVVTDSIGTYPAQYIVWFLPMVLWVSWSSVRQDLRDLFALLAVAVLALLWVLGPNQFGPIRWPVRVLPLFVLCFVVLLAILLDRHLKSPVPMRSVIIGVVWTMFAAYLTGSRQSEDVGAQVVSAILVSAGLIIVWWFLNKRSRPVATRAIPAFMVAMSLGLSVVQHAVHPVPPAVDYKMPAQMAAYRLPADTAQGDSILVGNPTEAILEDPSLTRDFVLASSWFLTQRDMQSVYSTIGFSDFNETYCRRYNGTSCRGLLKTLFEAEPTTGVLRADLMSVSTVQIYRNGLSAKTLASPPDGWRVSYTSADAVTWVRESARPAAGGVVWTSSGVRVEQTSMTSRAVTFRVLEAPATGGRVAFSRLAWPGYRVSGGELADPIEGYLLNVDVAGNAVGSTVTVSFVPPGWTLCIIAWWLSMGTLILWGIWPMVAALRRRQRRQDSIELSPGSAPAGEVLELEDRRV